MIILWCSRKNKIYKTVVPSVHFIQVLLTDDFMDHMLEDMAELNDIDEVSYYLLHLHF